MEISPLDFNDSSAFRRWWLDITVCHGFSQYEIPPSYHLPSADLNSVRFWEKAASVPLGCPQTIVIL